MLAPFGIRPKGTLQARMLPLAQALTRCGWRAVIVAPALQNPEDAGTRITHAGVAVIHTPSPTLPGPAGVAQQVWALVHTALAERPGLIHLFKPKGYSGLAALAIRMLHPTLPLVVDTDDWEGRGGWNDLLPYPAVAKLLFNWQERDLPLRAAAVTVASRTLQTQVWSFGVPTTRVFYLPNGVASQEPGVRSQEPGVENSAFRSQPLARRFSAGADHPRPLTLDPAADPAANAGTPLTLLLYTRFWEFEVRALVQTLVAVFQRLPTARLLVVGKGEHGEERELLRLATRAGIASQITAQGWVEPSQIPALLATADIALAPLDDTLINRARGMAKLLELMQAGLPIVAHRVGAADEYLEAEQSGLLVAPGDSGGFASAILRLAADSALRTWLGTHAQERATTHFNWQYLALTAETAYDYTLRDGQDSALP